MKRNSHETNLQNQGRLCIGSLPFVRLYRNNVGTLRDATGVPVSYGLAVGSADTIGIVAPHGRFLSIEWKAPGWVAPELTEADLDAPRGALSKEKERHRNQVNWAKQVTSMGGVAGFASSIEQGLDLVAVAADMYTQLGTDAARSWVTDTAREFYGRMTERDQRKKRR